jgi:hypothetical protein
MRCWSRSLMTVARLHARSARRSAVYCWSYLSAGSAARRRYCCADDAQVLLVFAAEPVGYLGVGTKDGGQLRERRERLFGGEDLG